MILQKLSVNLMIECREIFVVQLFLLLTCMASCAVCSSLLQNEALFFYLLLTLISLSVAVDCFTDQSVKQVSVSGQILCNSFKSHNLIEITYNWGFKCYVDMYKSSILWLKMLMINICWNKKALQEISVLFWPSIRTCCVMWHCLVSSHKSHAVDADSAF